MVVLPKSECIRQEELLKKVVHLSISEHEVIRNNVLWGILNGTAIVIEYLRDNKPVIVGILVVQDDELSGIRDMVIYGVASFENTSKDMWMECIDLCKKLAKANMCSRIIAKTDSHWLLSLVKELGWDTSTRFIRTGVE